MKKILANIAVGVLSVAAFCFIWFSSPSSSVFEKSAASMAVVLAVLYVCAARGVDDE